MTPVIEEAPFGGPGSDEYNAPVIRKTEWLKTHPGGTIGRPNPRELGMAATVDGTVIATAYADLSLLMNRVDQAEAKGLCPLHPLVGPGMIAEARIDDAERAE